ncbi:fibrobacter succinogenes major paralogous domain-containing protein [Chryseobacterium oryctis]|uniref:Fibrobacter succinogenes major paralogous domain-containing protein n=1 Tax=Chryseobacterium oryctis TaxID=2952618 RepID=A0ABT3HIT3_9FLAO|nr:fibrobacter succinogenes major paralogous domain-containing protein [Chryseobacterium oryctis]MCW3159696.1 fibrobacter succinogenes major paralogous domain-containing protein [Chryseobacterium oryctis]
MKNFKFVFFLLCIGVSLTSCRKEDLGSEDDNGNSSSNLVKVNANIILPQGITLTNPEVYKISSSDGDFSINPEYKIASKGITPGSTVYSCTPEVKTTGGNQLIFLTNEIGVPILYGYNTLPTMEYLQTFAGIYLSAESTAIATLLSYPQFASPYKDVQDGLSKEIIKMPSYNAYLNEVIDKITEVSKIPACPSVNYTELPSYRLVIGEFLNSAVMENYMIMKSNMEYSHISEINGVFKFKMINKGMRTVDIYANKVYLNNNVPYNKISIELSEQGEDPSTEAVMLKSKPVSYKTLVFGESLKSYLFGGSYPDYITMSETKEMTADVKDAQRLEVEVWGIGQPHKPFADFSDTETFRLCQVAMEAGYNDFINPIISLNEGIKMKVTEVQNIDGVFDFRYGSKKQPFKELIKKLTQAYLSQPNIKEKLYGYYTNKDYLELIQDMGVFIAREFYTDFNTAGNSPKYLNLVYNMYKNVAGITKTREQFRLSFKKCFASLWHWYDLAEKTIKISEASVTLAAAINDAYSSKTMVTFTKNISSLPDNPTVTDIDGHIYNTVVIGNQQWFKENLRVTRDINGQSLYGSIGYLNYYDNNQNYAQQLGGLYFLEQTNPPQNVLNVTIAPDGYRIPTKQDFEELINYYGSNAFEQINKTSGFSNVYAGNGHIYYSSYTNSVSKVYSGKDNYSIYLSSTLHSIDQENNGSIRKGYFYALKVDNSNQTVSIVTVPVNYRYYPYDNEYFGYSIRPIKN